MPDFETLLWFVGASLAVAVMPGPSTLYVLTRTLAHGRGAGLLSAAGLALGGLTHALAAALGLSAVLVYSPVAFLVIKLVGAVYLVCLGIATLRHADSASANAVPATGAGRIGRARIVGQAALTEILNPKVAMFFLAFLPQFVDTSAGAPAARLLLFGLVYTIVALPWDCTVALGGHLLNRVLSRRAWVQRGVAWCSGTVLIALGVRLALSRAQ